LTDTPLRMAVIGCGRMGADFGVDRSGMPAGWLPVSHAGAAKAVYEIALVALCDPDSERLNTAAAQFNVTATYTDAEDMLRQESPDLVAIATRMPGRIETILAAIEYGARGLHIEKPLGRSLAECRPALTAAKDNGTKLSYGTTRRFMDAYRQARDMVVSGAVGKLQHIAIEHGSDLLMWGHPHSTDLMIFFAQCPTATHVLADLEIDPANVTGKVIDTDPRVTMASVRFENGITASISPTAGLNTRLTGQDGVLAIEADGTTLTHYRRDPNTGYLTNVEHIDPQPEMSGTVRALKELAAAVREDGPSPMDPDDIEAGLRLLFSFAKSAVENRSIDPAKLDESFTVTGRFGDLTA